MYFLFFCCRLQIYLLNEVRTAINDYELVFIQKV